MKSKALLYFLTVLMLITPALADGTSLISPGGGMKWLSEQSPEFQSMIIWIIEGAVALLGITFIVTTLGNASAAQYEGSFGSQEAKSHKYSVIVKGLIMTVVAMLLVYVGLKVFTWF
jgi:uncharacterized membrane protein